MRVLRASPRWDGRHGELVIDDAGQSLQMLAQFSAEADAVEAMRFEVREGLVRYPDATHTARHSPAHDGSPSPQVGTRPRSPNRNTELA